LKKFNVSEDAKILDAGAGTGIFSNLAAENGFNDLTLVDIYDSMLGVAQKKSSLGSMKFIVGDIETAVRLGLKILIVLLNSNSNALIERYQLKGKYGKINKKNTSFGKVDFAMLAQANGCQSGTAQNIEEFNVLLERADRVSGPFLIEVPIHYPEHYVNEYSVSD
jgi:SAM-dependent methyltransferase